MDVTLPEGSTLQALFDRFEIPPEERGYVFRNAVLHDMPGLNVAGRERLQDGDHVGIFSVDRTWPFQYRQGAPLSPALAEALKERDAMRHTYREKGARGR
jgi:hypothetical protein